MLCVSLPSLRSTERKSCELLPSLWKLAKKKGKEPKRKQTGLVFSRLSPLAMDCVCVSETVERLTQSLMPLKKLGMFMACKRGEKERKTIMLVLTVLRNHGQNQPNFWTRKHIVWMLQRSFCCQKNNSVLTCYELVFIGRNKKNRGIVFRRPELNKPCVSWAKPSHL